MSFRVIGHHLQIAQSTAHRIYKRFEETGDVTYMKQPSRPTRRRLDEYRDLLLIAMVMENPCVYLQEMCNQIELVTAWCPREWCNCVLSTQKKMDSPKRKFK